MELVMQCVITGHKTWVADGGRMDTGSIFIEAPLKNSKKEAGYGGEMGQGFAKGYATQLYKCKNAEVINRIRHLDVPLSAQVILEQETDGNGEINQVVLDIRPNPVQRPGAAPDKPGEKKAA